MSMDMTSITRKLVCRVRGANAVGVEGAKSTWARPAGLLRVLAGTPAGTQVTTHRRGSFLVLVVGTLALLAVITIVYVALGSQDSRTKASVQQRAQLDDVPAAVADYTAGVIARDLFSSTIDGSMVQFRSNSGPNGGPVGLALKRETEDAPGIVHRQGVPAASAADQRFQRMTSERDPAANDPVNGPVEARNYFTPEGTVHPALERALLDPASNATEDLRPAAGNGNVAGALSEFRLPPSDPWLMPLRPSFINFGAGGGNGGADTFVAVDNDPRPYLQQLDWTHITNIAPDGMFVNLANLRGNFGAFSNTDDGGANVNSLPGMGFGKSLLEPRNQSQTGTNAGRYRFIHSINSSTVWGLDLAAQVPDADKYPFYWSTLQRGAFRPSKPGLDPSGNAPDLTEDPASEFYKGLQWADADGDGMLDSRWWELRRWQDNTGATVAINGEDELPEFSGNFRWFIASRIVDLSGLVNVNFAGDLAAAIRSPMFLDPALAADPTVARGANTTMALGMTPGDVDLRRLLAQLDTYANYNVADVANVLAGYEGLEPANPDPAVFPNAEAYETASNEERAFRAGTTAYMNLQIANRYGQIVGTNGIELQSGNLIPLVEDQEEDLGSANGALTLGFVDQNYPFGGIPVGAVNSPNGAISTFGLRGWQSFTYPSQRFTDNAAAPFDAGPFAGIRNYPPYGPDLSSNVNTHYGWIDWSARRTLNYINQSRKINAASSNPFDEASVAKLKFGISDLAELLTYRGINDPLVTSNLEKALGAKDETPAAAGAAADFLRVDPLRSNRELAAEAATFNPFDQANNAIYTDPDQPMGRVLRRLATDVRQYLTTISLSRPLRSTTRPAGINVTNPIAAGAGYSSSLSADEGKINAREALDLPPRAKESGPSPVNPLPPYQLAAESTARIFFNGYVEALAPHATLDAAWLRNDPDFQALRTLFYGYRGAELAVLTAGHMAVNMVDLADGPTPAPLLAGGPDVWVEGADGGIQRAPNNIADAQAQPIRPGVSDVRDKPTIRTLLLTDDPSVRALLDGGAAANITARRIMATWQRPTDLAPGSNPPAAIDNLDLASNPATQGKLAPTRADVIAPVVKLYGIEAQPFLTQVTTMSVYFDNWYNDSDTGFNIGNEVQIAAPAVAGPQPSDPNNPDGANNLTDGANINRSELLFSLVAFKLTNPFDRDIVLGKPLLSDVPPNSVVGVPNGPAGNAQSWQYSLPDQPIELVPDAALRSIDPSLTPAARRGLLVANRDDFFPVRSDRLGMYSRTSRWTTGLITGNPPTNGSIVIGPGASGTWSRNGALGVFGAWARGDLVDVSDPAFLNASTPPVPVDSISDFHYIRFGNRSYMLMALNEQYTFSDQTIGGTGPNAAEDYYADRPDGKLAVPGQDGVPGNSGSAADLQRAAIFPPDSLRTVPTTLSPIRIPAGKTVVCYALSESPFRIRERMVAINNVNPTLFGLAQTSTPTDGGGNGANLGADGLADGQAWMELGPFFKKVIEHQLARAGSDTSLATDLFNPNGAYWIPMIWERPNASTNTPPAGFGSSGLQNINVFVNPIPPQAAPVAGSVTERTATLWRTVREQRPTNPADPVPVESDWFQAPSFANDFLGTPINTAAASGDQDAIDRRPQAAVGSSSAWRMGVNAWDNDQMVDRLRIPSGANLRTQLQSGKPVIVVGSNTRDYVNPVTGNPDPANDPDRAGYSMVLWATVLRPSDPQTSLNVGDPFDPLQSIPNDVLPGYCLEAKYWDSDTPGASWNLFRQSPLWEKYLASTNGEFDLTNDFRQTAPDNWNGAARSLRQWIEFQSATPAFSSTPSSDEPTLAESNILPATYLWQAPNNIVPRGYLDTTNFGFLAAPSAARSLEGSIDRRPNATIQTPLAPGVFPGANQPPGTPLLSGYLAYPEMYPQVSMDSDAERGRLSNNFYRDVDVRRSTGNTGGGAFGSAPRFNESDHYYRWVSILRLGDMLRPLGIGPLEAPFNFPASGAPTVRVFTPSAQTAAQIQANNARYTTLGEALAAAMGYENRFYNAIPRHAGAHTRDINLLRSPYALPGLAGESTVNGPFHLKAPPGARTPGTSTAIEAGDASTDTMLFDRGNLRLDHFVPFVDADTQDTVLDIDTNGTDAERVVGPAVPLAQMVLEQFETPATDPANPEPLTGENVGRFAARQGLINVNTAPVEVLRLLPGVTPRAYSQPSTAADPTIDPLGGTERPTRLPLTGVGEVGDADWFRQVPGVRPALPVNQTLDLAAGIAGYRDMVPVVLSRAAYDHVVALRSIGGGPGDVLPDGPAATTFEPVASLFLSVPDGAGDLDPYVFDDPVSGNVGKNARSATRIMGVEGQPGFRTVGELLSVRSRENETPLVYTSRWPSGNVKPANQPRHTPWAAAPYNVDALGFDQTVNPAGNRLALNSTFDEIDPQAGRIDLGLPATPTDQAPKEDDPYDNPYERQPIASRNDPRLATAGIANEYDEKLILANNFLNTVTNRSDVYAVWFTLAGFQRSDVEGLDPTDPITPSVRRRFVMVVDRSNVTTRGTKPRILMMKEVPMPRE
jgi:hypothetical protein